MAPNYYNCQSNRHTEHTCLAAYYHKRGFTREKWCVNCQDRYPLQVGAGE